MQRKRKRRWQQVAFGGRLAVRIQKTHASAEAYRQTFDSEIFWTLAMFAGLNSTSCHGMFVYLDLKWYAIAVWWFYHPNHWFPLNNCFLYEATLSAWSQTMLGLINKRKPWSGCFRSLIQYKLDHDKFCEIWNKQNPKGRARAPD